MYLCLGQHRTVLVAIGFSNRRPWRLWWGWAVDHMLGDSGPSKPKAWVRMVSRLQSALSARSFLFLLSSLRTTSPETHTHTQTHAHRPHQKKPQPCAGLSFLGWKGKTLYFPLVNLQQQKMSKMPVFTTCPTFANIASKGTACSFNLQMWILIRLNILYK